VSRRGFIGGGAALAGAAALAGYLPDSVLRAQAASAASRSSFDLSQVKHLVFLMQENRSFDHYFGTFPGVRRALAPAVDAGVEVIREDGADGRHRGVLAERLLEDAVIVEPARAGVRAEVVIEAAVLLDQDDDVIDVVD